MKGFLVKKSQLWMPVVYLIIAFSVLALLQYFGAASPHMEVDVRDGAADLRGFDFASSIARVDGAEFFPNALLSPSDLETAIPGTWDDGARYLTVRVRLLVSEGDYLIYGKGPDYASRIFVNGTLADTVGSIDEDNENNNIYQTTQFRALARPQNGVVDVVFHIVGIIRDDPAYHGLFIGGYEPASSRLLRDAVYGLVPVVIFITCALFYFGYFLFMPSAKTNLWFALISLTIGVFLSYNWKIGYHPFPVVDYRVEYAGFHVALLMICVFYSFFTRSLFSTSKTVPIVVCIGSALIAGVFIALPIGVTSNYSFIHTVFVFAVMAVNITLIAIRFRQFKTEHTISFCGQIVFMLSGALDMLGFRFMDFWDFSSAGMLVFLFTQMASLYLVNNRAVENEHRLAAEYASLEKQSKWKEGLVRKLSHELKTPLTAISNVSQLARMHTTDEYVQQKLDIAIAEVEGMKLTVGKMFELSEESAES